MRAFLLQCKSHGLYGWRAVLMTAALSAAGYAPNAFAAPKTHTVVIEALQFVPQVLEVKPGDTVVWVNKDAFPHNATATNHGFRSKDIGTNESWRFKVLKKGTFDYVCTLHPTMKASLVVK